MMCAYVLKGLFSRWQISKAQVFLELHTLAYTHLDSSRRASILIRKRLISFCPRSCFSYSEVKLKDVNEENDHSVSVSGQLWHHWAQRLLWMSRDPTARQTTGGERGHVVWEIVLIDGNGRQPTREGWMVSRSPPAAPCHSCVCVLQTQHGADYNCRANMFVAATFKHKHSVQASHVCSTLSMFHGESLLSLCCSVSVCVPCTISICLRMGWGGGGGGFLICGTH